VVSILARDSGGPDVKFQALIYPVTNCAFDTPSYAENADGYLLTKDSMVWFWGHYLNNEGEGKSVKASPLCAENLAGLPPALVITAEFDPLRDEGNAYAKALKDAGVDVQHRQYEGQIHGFYANPGIDDGQEAARWVGQAVGKALG
jgi:acetyl esterase